MNKQSPSLKVINRASLISALTNGALAILKIVFGIIGFSYALLTDGIHSLSDVVVDGLVVISARIGQSAPDSDHPYGHRRIETIGTIVISLIILAVGLTILVENILRLIHHTAAHRPLPVVFAVALISVIANEWLYRYMLKKSREINSQLLQSNAWHNRSDAFTSIIVIISAVFAWFGWHQVDAIAAIVISAFIIKMGAQYAWRSLKELVDTGVDPELVQKLEQAITATPGVVSLHQLRTRMHADAMLLDGHVQVDPRLSVSEGHYIGTAVYQRIREVAPNLLDATIHIDVEDDDEVYEQSIQLPENRQQILGYMETLKDTLPGFNQLKNLTLHYLSKKIEVEILLPLSLLNHCSYDDLVLQYNACLCELSGIKSVSINFFRD
jgi:cation diffusion facilitator family transporter